MLKGMKHKTPEGKRFNKQMGRACVSIKTAVAGMLQQWQAIDHKNLNKLGQAQLALHVAIAAFLYNLQGILSENQVSNGGLG